MLPKSARVWRCARHARQTNVATAIAATTDPMSQPWDIREYSPIAGYEHYCQPLTEIPDDDLALGLTALSAGIVRDSGGRRPKAVWRPACRSRACPKRNWACSASGSRFTPPRPRRSTLRPATSSHGQRHQP